MMAKRIQQHDQLKTTPYLAKWKTLCQQVILLCVPLVILMGCVNQPPSLVQEPTSVRPQPKPMALPSNGSIFHVANYRPLFQDRLPSQVGDTLTVTIQENSNTSASQQQSNSRKTGLSSQVEAGMKLPFIPLSMTDRLQTGFSATGSGNHSGKGNSQVSTSFMSSITVTVVEVLENGNLVISGEKAVRINNDIESIRLSGVINPLDINPNRSISSLKIADARIEQITQGNNRLFSEPGWLARFFMSLLPI